MNTLKMIVACSVMMWGSQALAQVSAADFAEPDYGSHYQNSGSDSQPSQDRDYSYNNDQDNRDDRDYDYYDDRDDDNDPVIPNYPVAISIPSFTANPVNLAADYIMDYIANSGYLHDGQVLATGQKWTKTLRNLVRRKIHSNGDINFDLHYDLDKTEFDVQQRCKQPFTVVMQDGLPISFTLDMRLQTCRDLRTKSKLD